MPLSVSTPVESLGGDSFFPHAADSRNKRSEPGARLPASRFQRWARGLCLWFGLVALFPAVTMAAGPVLEVEFTTSQNAEYVPGQTRSVTLVFSNTGDATATDTKLVLDVPDGASLQGVSCQSTGASGSVCGTANNGTYTGGTLVANGKLTVVANLQFATAATGNKTVGAEGSATGITAVNDSFLLARVAPSSDLAVTVTATALASVASHCPDPDPTDRYTPGCTAAYTVEVKNLGPDPADKARVSIARTEAASDTFGWTCVAGSSGETCPAASIPAPLIEEVIDELPVNGTLTFTVEVDHDISDGYPTAGITAKVELPDEPSDWNDPHSANNEASASRTRNPIADLVATVTAKPISPAATNCPGEIGIYTPGCTANYEVEIENQGPDPVAGASFSIHPVEASTVIMLWACDANTQAQCEEEGGSGAIENLTIQTIAAGGKLTYTVAVMHPSSQLDALAGLEAQIVPPTTGTIPFDPDTDNNTSKVERTIERRAATRVEKIAAQGGSPVSSVFANVGFDYEIVVYNDGPSDLGNAVDGSGNPKVDPDGPALVLTDMLDSRFIGVSGNGCTVAQDGPPCWTYCASNLDLIGEGGVTDLDTCSEVQKTNGSGYQINERFALRAGSASRLKTRVKVATVAETISIPNLAEIELTGCPSPGSCTPISQKGDAGSQSDTVSITIQRATDLVGEVTNQTGTSATPGLEHEYRIKLKNPAYFHLANVKVDSVFPLAQGSVVSGFVPGSVRYACRATDGASCTTVGGGDNGQGGWTDWVTADALDTSINLPALSQVEYRVIGLVDPRARDDMHLSVHATSQGVDDLDAGVDTSMTPSIGLTLSKRLYKQEDVGNGQMRLFYEITAGNVGPSFADGVKLEDSADTVSNPGNFVFATAQWDCTAVPATAPAIAPGATQCRPIASPPHVGGIEDGDLLLDLMPGGKAVVNFEITTSESASDQVENKARVSHPLGTREATATATLRSNYALTVTKTDGKDKAHPGTQHSYALTIHNAGPDDAYDIQVRDQMPAMLQDVRWTCSATSPVPGDLGPLPDQTSVSPATRPGYQQAISADGRHVYVLGENISGVPTVYAYARNATPGLGYGEIAPEPIDIEVNDLDNPNDTGSAVAGMGAPVDLALALDGSVLYVLSSRLEADGTTVTGTIVVFHRVTDRLNPDFGRLSYAGTSAIQTPLVQRIAVSATHVYVTGSVPGGSAQVEVLRPDPGNQLPVTVGSPVAAPTSVGPLVIDQAAGWLYAASTFNSQIQRYRIEPSGQNIGRLTADVQTPLDVVNHQQITDLVLAPGGGHLYGRAANGGSNARLVHVRAEAVSLAFQTATTTQPASLLDGPVRIAMAADGEHLFGVNANTDAVFTVRRDVNSGALGATEQVLYRSDGFNGLEQPTSVLGTPDGRHILVTSGSTTGPGPLTTLSRRAPAPQLGFIEMDRQQDPIAGTQLEIDTLTAANDVVTRGKYVYVLSKIDAAITLFERRLITVGPDDEDGGHLTWKNSWRDGQAGITGMASPSRLLLSPDGKSAFVSSVSGNSVVVFRRDPDTGNLTYAQTFLAAGNPGLSGAFGMAMDSDSRHLYVAGSFAASIAIFKYDANDSQRLTYQGAVVAGQDGVSGLNGIRDLVVASAGGHSQVLGVSDAAGTVVVFDRETTGASAGNLSFVQALGLGSTQRPMALALSPDTDGSGNAHVYVAAQNGNAVHVLQRVIHPADPAYGQIRLLGSVVQGVDAPQVMSGPRDVAVSADGKRVYVTAEFGHSLVAFDRYDNVSSALYGQLALAETRTQDIDAADGIRAPYAVAVADDSRNVYVAGFDSNAVASFSVGTGSSCSASGVGDIDDVVTIRAGGAVSYVIDSMIRADATGVLENTATAFAAGVTPDANDVVPTGYDSTDLLTSARLEVTKTNNQVAVMPGTQVTYDITVRNAGPGNVGMVGNDSLTHVTDLFGCTAANDCSGSPFDVDTIEWTCSATGSGMLEFLADYRQGESGITGLRGVSSLALIPGDAMGTGDEVRGNFLVGASVDDNGLAFFQRDAMTGNLAYYAPARVVDGPGLPLQGARSVSISQDGRLLFVASRQSDSLVVFGLSGSSSQDLIVTPLAVARDASIAGLDKALHVVAVTAGANVEHVYVAGANDHAVAGFSFNRDTQELSHIGSWVNNVGNIRGLADVEYLIVGPGGDQVYALSGSGASIAQFNRNVGTGQLTYVTRFTSTTLGVDLQGVSAGVFAVNDNVLYLVATQANRLVTLTRDTSTGNLSLVTSLGQGEQGAQGLNEPRRIVISPDGHHVYVTSQAGNSLAWFSLDGAGVPKYLGARVNQSSGVAGLGGASGLVLDPQLDLIYVAGTLDQAIVQFQRQSDSWCPPSGTGLLQSVPVNIAANGEVVFRVTARVSSDLAVPLVNVASVDWTSADCGGGDGLSAQACATEDQDTDEISSVADLSITKDDGLAEFDGLAGAVALVADTRNVYVAAPDDNAIGVFQRQTGAATGVGLRYLGVMRSGVAGVSGLTGVVNLAMSADGKNLYAVSPVDGAIAVFNRGQQQGRLEFVEKHQSGLLGVTGMRGAQAVALSPDGAHVYVAGGFSNAVAIFRRQNQVGAADYGRLQFVAAVEAGIAGVNGIESPRDLRLSPDGAQLYVLGGSGTVVAFSRQTNSGSGNYGRLTQLARYQNGSDGVLGMDDVRSLALTADGAHLYVLGAEAGTLVHFARDASTGTLEFQPDLAVGGSLQLAELAGARRIRVASDGYLYAAASQQDAVLVFELDGAGVPTLVTSIQQGQPIDGLRGASDMVVVSEAGSDWLYTGASQDSALSVFDLDDDPPTYVGSLFDGAGGVAPGDEVTYTIVVTNNGPSDVAQARVVDVFPPEFESVHWTCAGNCPGTGQGNIDQIVSLPKGSQVQFDATATVRAQASGRLINTATVTAIDVLDPDLSNNSATDDDTVLSPSMDLAITIDVPACDPLDPGCAGPGQATPGGTLAYAVVATNAGPTHAVQAQVSNVLPEALYDVVWTCTATPEAGLLEEIDLQENPLNQGYRAVVVDPLGQYAYAVGPHAQGGTVQDAVAAFARNPLDGSLSSIPAYADVPAPGEDPAQGMAGARALVISPDGRFVYVAGHDADAVVVFERDPGDGHLRWRSMVQDSEQGISGIGGVSTLVIAPDGKHLYAAGAASQAIAGFAINASNGALSQVSVLRQDDGLNGLNDVTDLAFDATGEVLFATAGANRSVTALRRDAASGVLTWVTAIEDGEPGVTASLLLPSALWVDADRLFVADAGAGVVNLLRFVDGDAPAFELDAMIDLDADSGVAGQQPVALAYVADQARLYVASTSTSQLHLYGLLGETPARIASYDLATSTALEQVADFVVAPGEREIHVVSGSQGRINTLAREPGSRCPLSGIGGINQEAVDIAPGGQVRFDLNGHIFANATGNLVHEALIDPRVLAWDPDFSNNRTLRSDLLVPAPDLEARKLRQTPAAEVIAGLPVNWWVEIENHGISDALQARLIDELPIFPGEAYGLTEDTGQWSCSGSPPLVQTSWLATATEPAIADLAALVPARDGQRWFGLSRSRSAVVELSLDANGAISQVQTRADAATVAALTGATDLELSADGAYLYVTSSTSDAARNGQDLTEAERNGNAPYAVVTGNVLVFAVHANSLEHVQTITSGVDGVSGLRGARQLLASSDGRFVYVAAVPANISQSAIAAFRRDAETGQLVFIERIQDGLGTFGNASNVIRDLQRMTLTTDGRYLYTLASGSLTNQQALGRFQVDVSSGKLQYQSVIRAVDIGADDAVDPALLGARDMVMTPGDTQVLVLTTQGFAQFTRLVDGSLAAAGTWAGVNPDQARYLAIDALGSRVYVAAQDGSLELYARQWSDGALEHRYSLPAAVSASAGMLKHLGASSEVLLAQDGGNGGLTRWSEQALVKCHVMQGTDADLPVLVDLGVQGWARMDYSAIVHPSARGDLLNIARAEPGSGVDPDLGNNIASDQTPIHVVSDLSISKTGPENAVAGEFIQYQIRVENAGPSDALGIHVVDALDPAMFQDASWTCEVEGDGQSQCLASQGAGLSLDAEADLHVGDTLVVNLNVRVHPAWLGPLQNAASVVPEPGSVDPTPDDHEATPVQTEVMRRADLVVSKHTDTPEVVAGAAVAYTVEVHNAGPSDAPEVRVQDLLPEGLRAATWTCTALQGRGDCVSASGSGSVNRVVSIPVGETLRYQINATLAPSAEGTLTNMATATLLDDPAGEVEDPDLTNNEAGVSDPILQRADLALVVTAPDAFDPASQMALAYQVQVFNNGPSDAGPGALAIHFNHEVSQDHVDCTPAQGTDFTCEIEGLEAGQALVFGLGLRQLPSAPATLLATAQVDSQTDDPDLGNNQVNTTILLRTGVDLEITIDDGREGLNPGDDTRYTITVRNLGSVDAVDARVQVPLAAELLDGVWQCSHAPDAYCSASGIDDIDDLIDLPAGGTLTYRLDVTLNSDNAALPHDEYDQTAEVEVDPGQDEVSLLNNVATDHNRIYKVIFRDDFEDPQPPRQAPAALPLSLMQPGLSPFRLLPTPGAAMPSPPADAPARRPSFNAGKRS